MFNKIPKHISFFISVYLIGIFFFSGFRLLLLFTEIEQVNILPEKWTLVFAALWMGFRFDTVISGYILLLPLVVLSIIHAFRWEKSWLYKIFSAYLILFYLLAFAICSADIPFFHYYFSRLNISVFNWIDSPAFVSKMLIQEPRYFIFFFLFFLVCFLFVFLLKKSRVRFLETKRINRSLISHIVLSLLSCGVLFIGIRGRISKKSPIKVGTAYFSNYAFPNQLGLNPVFTFGRSWLEKMNPENKRIQLMNEDSAIAKAKIFLNIPEHSNFPSPIARQITTDEKPNNANVIVVIMESMSAAKMSRYGNPNYLTPTLDSIANISYCFENIYTAGIHTFNGIYSTLFSFPALMQQHTMNSVTLPEFTGIGKILSEHGYQTIYFTTHDEQFDNVGGFIKNNGYQQIISQKDFPSEKVLSTLGVPDDYLFEFSIPILNKLHKNNKPFMAAFMTASDHGPYTIPSDIPFQPHSKDIRQQIVEYADWSIKKFLTLASREAWFKNTIFVFIADHGAVMDNNVYDMPLSFHHTPCIIYSPLFSHPQSFKQIGGQIDIYPTIMGLLNINYVNNTIGIDLLKEKRPFIYFSADDKIGCLNHDFFLVIRNTGKESLYNYNQQDTKDFLSEYRNLADSMRTYTFSMLQTTQSLISNKKTGIQKTNKKYVGK